jgi:hypothetical protein
VQLTCETLAVFSDFERQFCFLANDSMDLQKVLFSLSKKKKPNSKKALLSILLPYDITNVKKIFEWWRRLGRIFFGGELGSW